MMWFIKKKYEKEYKERTNENKNIINIAEEMCKEGKGKSFLNSNAKNSMCFLDMIMPFKLNRDYFEVSIFINTER